MDVLFCSAFHLHRFLPFHRSFFCGGGGGNTTTPTQPQVGCDLISFSPLNLHLQPYIIVYTLEIEVELNQLKKRTYSLGIHS
ncbi:hypothetical protein M5689_003040 [Euphorbia peplus]|nr:hypothetical protein M5689_003040 [Euphorbia peplus]